MHKVVFIELWKIKPILHLNLLSAKMPNPGCFSIPLETGLGRPASLTTMMTRLLPSPESESQSMQQKHNVAASKCPL
jgi:hypothetical protein